jgi:hypothetical protein
MVVTRPSSPTLRMAGPVVMMSSPVAMRVIPSMPAAANAGDDMPAAPLASSSCRAAACVRTRATSDTVPSGSARHTTMRPRASLCVP